MAGGQRTWLYEHSEQSTARAELGTFPRVVHRLKTVFWGRLSTTSKTSWWSTKVQIFYFHRHVGSVLVQHWQHLLGSLLVSPPSLPWEGCAIPTLTGSLGQFSIQSWLTQNLAEHVRRKGWKELLQVFQRGIYRICSSLSILPRQREGQDGRAAKAAGSWLWPTAPRHLDKSSPGLFQQVSPWP